MRKLILFITALGVAACQPATSETKLSSTQDVAVPDATIAPAFVQAACGGCHGVEPDMLSPNPAAPAFADLANREGLTRDTLTVYLHDAHNYPEVMDFDLDEANIAEIADYVLTLRDPEYRRIPD